MGSERIIVCGGVNVPGAGNGAGSRLDLDVCPASGPANVMLQSEDIRKPLCKDVPAAFQDLMEIAAYVYTADQATGRGGMDVDTFGERWRRTFLVHVPVRRPDFWRSAEVSRTLCETLGFLSDDHYEFTFYRAVHATPFQSYLNLGDGDGAGGPAQQVIMFSGGLDSLAGAIEEAVVQKRRVVLVTHRPTQKHNNRQRELQRLLAEKAGALRPAHVTVRINKNKEMSKEPSQRSRSFLFMALGATVAKMMGLDSVRFYENGVVSLNLPICEQVVGARATRTTHPRVLKGFQALLSLVSGKAFTVENPFLWATKGEIISRILKAECGPMITSSISCAHTWESTLEHPHCGTCSQCIDRRFGVIAAGAEEFDLAQHYRVDIFGKSLPEDADRIMGAAYLERANVFQSIRDGQQLVVRYPQVAEVLRYLDLDRASAAARILDLHKRHGKEVSKAARQMLRRHDEDIFTGRLPGDCFLRIMFESRGLPVMGQPAGEGVDAGAARDAAANGKLVFRKVGRVWKVVLDGGEEIVIRDALGARYLDYLFHHPSEAISAYDLEITITPEKGEVRAKDSIQKGLDPETIRNYLREVDKLRGKRETAVDEGDAGEVERLDGEIEAIEAALKKGGIASDAGERARGNVSKAIRAVQRSLLRGDRHEKAFGLHIKECVSMGYNFRYCHPTGGVWH